MTLLQLQYFQSVCKNGNITKAAREMHVSQPTITTSIKELESELNVNLFSRNNKMMALTQEGQMIFERISLILSDLGSLTEEIKDLVEKRNHIKLGLPLQVGAFLLPVLIKDFQSLNPKITLELIESSALEIKNLVLREEMDVAVAAVDADNPNLLWEPLFQTEICFCTSKTHPLAKRSSISLKEACLEPLVLFDGSFYTTSRVQARLTQENLTPFVRLYTNQLSTIKSLVANAGLSTFLLKEAIHYDRDLVPIGIDEPIAASVGMLTKKGRHVYKDSQKLMQFIINQYAAL